MLALSYKKDGYPNDVIKTIFYKLGYTNINLDFDLNTFSSLDFIKAVFVDNIYDIYHSALYKDYIKLFIKDKNN